MGDLAAEVRSGPSRRFLERAMGLERPQRSAGAAAAPSGKKAAAVAVGAMAVMFGLESHARGAARCDQLLAWAGQHQSK